MEDSGLLFDIKRVEFNDSIKKWLLTTSQANNKAFLNNNNDIIVYTFLYKSLNGYVQGFIALPRNIKGSLPCIVTNRGGTGKYGMLKPGHFFTGVIPKLVQKHYIVIASQYSGSGLSDDKDSMGGDDIYDIIRLFPIIKSLPFVDEKRIGMHGQSRGGMLIFLCLKKVHWIRACVLINPLTNLFSTESFRPEMQIHFRKVFGGSHREMKKRSAYYWVSKLPKKLLSF